MPFDAERIRKSTRRVKKFVKRDAKRPSSDAVHKFRTSARHIETALLALQLDSKRGVASFLKDLDRMRRLAGKVRDMDVLTANLLNVDARGEQDCVVRLLEHLGAERSERVRKLRAAIAKRPKRLRRSVERAARRIERLGGEVRKPVGLALELSSKLGHPGRLSRANLHAYRLKVKELRDVLRLSDREADTALVGKLQEVKDAIGEWHDWVELTDIARDVLDHKAACALSKRLVATRDEKYERALSLTQTLIARHLRPRPRSRKRSAKAPIAQPVLDAVAAIAEDEEPKAAH